MKKYLDALSFFANYRSPVVVILIICLVTGIPRTAFAISSWTLNSNAPGDFISAVATSADGTHAVAGSQFGGVYITTDSGADWSYTFSPTNSSKHWAAMAMSANGQDIVGVEQNGGYIWLSTDSGTTWAKTNSTIAGDWTSVSMSSDGQHIVAGTSDNGILYLSNNGGISWSSIGQGSIGALSNEAYAYDAVAYSPNGNYIVVASKDGSGDIAISTNHGTSWTENIEPSGTVASSTNWSAIAVSNSGKIVVGGLGSLYVSNNGGTNWTNTGVTDNGEPWGSISMSADGSIIAANTATQSGYIYQSTDGGNTFAKQTGPGLQSWGTLAVNSNDGTVGYAGVPQGGYGIMYEYKPAPDTTPPTVSLTSPAPSAHLSGTVSLTASSTDNVGVTGIQYYVNGAPYGALGTGGISPYTIPLNTTVLPFGTTTIAVAANDAALNYATSTEQVFVDNTPPVITVLGANPATIVLGTTYTDAGASATDSLDGNLTSSIVKTGTVNTSSVGTYTINYSVTNSAGDVATSSRTVIVQSAPQVIGGSSGGGTVQNQVTNLLQNGNTAGAASLEQEYRNLFTPGTGTQASSSSATSTTKASVFTRALTLGMTGADVLALQKYLNSHGYIIAITGPGSPDNETTYFGKATRAALAKFQKAHGITPAAGYFGSITRAYIEAHP